MAATQAVLAELAMNPLGNVAGLAMNPSLQHALGRPQRLSVPDRLAERLKMLTQEIEMSEGYLKTLRARQDTLSRAIQAIAENPDLVLVFEALDGT